MRNTKQGISLIVLVITIIVMIILAAAVIISLNNTGIIKTAHNAVCMTNIKQAQNLAVLVWSNIYTNPDEYTMDNVEDKLKAEFEKNGLKYEDYNVEVTKNGINVSSKAGCTDSSGVEGGNGGNNSQVIDPSWTHAYAYSKSTDAWTLVENTGTEPTADVAARFYVTETVEEEFKPEKGSGVTLTVNKYKMVVSGNGRFDFHTGTDPQDIFMENEEYEITSLNMVTEIEVQEGITELGTCVVSYDGEFELYSLVEKVTLPSTLKSIDDEVFMECYSLESITLPKGLETIGDYAFCACENLKQVVIPEGVTRIGEGAFNCCYALETVSFPDSLLTMGPDAFSNCYALTEVKLPKNLTALESYETYDGSWGGVFAYCTSLTKINIPSKVASWKYALEGCESLKEIVIENGVKNIDTKILRSANLKNTVIIVPTSVTTIDDPFYKGMYSGATATIKYKGTEAQWNAISGLDTLPTSGITVEYNYSGN